MDRARPGQAGPGQIISARADICSLGPTQQEICERYSRQFLRENVVMAWDAQYPKNFAKN